jgi:hypothetical protein
MALTLVAISRGGGTRTPIGPVAVCAVPDRFRDTLEGSYVEVPTATTHGAPPQGQSPITQRNSERAGQPP